jgi:hypothetical protein
MWQVQIWRLALSVVLRALLVMIVLAVFKLGAARING